MDLPDMIQHLKMDATSWEQTLKNAGTELKNFQKDSQNAQGMLQTLQRELAGTEKATQQFLNTFSRATTAGSVAEINKLTTAITNYKAVLSDPTLNKSFMGFVQSSGRNKIGAMTTDDVRAAMEATVHYATRFDRAESPLTRKPITSDVLEAAGTMNRLRTMANPEELGRQKWDDEKATRLRLLGAKTREDLRAEKFINEQIALSKVKDSIPATPAQVAGMKQLLALAAGPQTVGASAAQLAALRSLSGTGVLPLGKPPQVIPIPTLSLARQPMLPPQGGGFGTSNQWAALLGAGFGGSGGGFFGGLGGAMGGLTGGPIGAAAGGVGGKVIDSILNGAMTVAVGAVTLSINAATAALDLMGRAASEAFSQGAAMEKMRTTFEVLTRDIQKGTTLFENIQKLSINTPLSGRQLGDTGQMLLGMGMSAEQVRKALPNFAQIAGGDPDRMRRLGLVAGEIHAEGRISGWRVRQLASLGIGTEDMAAAMGIPVQMFRPMLRGNRVGAEVFDKTINMLNAPGGRFEQMLTRQLETVQGQMGRLGGIFEQIAGKAGMAFIESSGLAKVLASLGDRFADLIPSAIEFGTALGKIAHSLIETGYNFVRGVIGDKKIPTSEDFVSYIKSLQDSFDELSSNAYALGETFADVASDLIDIIKGMADTIASIPSLIVNAMGGQGLSNLGGIGGILNFGANAIGMGGFPGLGGGILAGAVPGLGLMQGGIGGVGNLGEQWKRNFQLNKERHKGFFLPEPNAPNIEKEPIEVMPSLSHGAQSALESVSKLADGMRDLSLNTEGIIPPLTQFNDVLSSIKELDAGGWLSGTQKNQLFFAGYQKLVKDVGAKSIADNLPRAMDRGSVEAIDTMNKAQIDNRSVMEEMASTMQASLDQQVQMKDYMREVADAFNGLEDKFIAAADAKGIKIVKVGVKG